MAAFPVDVRARVAGIGLLARTSTTGEFAFEHVPAGLLEAVTATATSPGTTSNAVPSVTAAVYPKLQLDSAHPTAFVELQLDSRPPLTDVYEPDDELKDVATRAAITRTVAEMHVLGADDVDLVPFTTAPVSLTHVKVRPTDGRRADLALEIVDKSGAVLASSNIRADEYSEQPSLDFLSGPNQLATLYVRVSRNDQVRRAVPYALIVE